MAGHDSLQSGIRAMVELYRGMSKLTDSNYLVWKSKMRDMLVCEDLQLPVQFGNKRPDKIDAAVWEVLHLMTTAYIRCFIYESYTTTLAKK